MKKYGVLNYGETESPYKLRFILPYSTTEEFEDVKKMNFEIFVQQVFGVLMNRFYGDWEDDFININKNTIMGGKNYE